MEDKELHKKSYIKVIDYIKNQIRDGKLSMGGKLPAERELSMILGLAVIPYGRQSVPWILWV
ncbi:GntR family transcriptional regulator [Anaerocolumna sedimenticola]|uniref:GntR family transcriptional regulator n=1 Tax=Anaerocolumna sedimenticola TaxID=2696063 RepID=UPI001FE6DA8D|nr:GntR family transcriptional regulator [Anaerocolumna sedimenticola]